MTYPQQESGGQADAMPSLKIFGFGESLLCLERFSIFNQTAGDCFWRVNDCLTEWVLWCLFAFFNKQNYHSMLNTQSTCQLWQLFCPQNALQCQGHGGRVILIAIFIIEFETLKCLKKLRWQEISLRVFPCTSVYVMLDDMLTRRNCI